MNGAELYGRVLTINYALPECSPGWAAQPIWADVDNWFKRQQQQQEMQRLQAEQRVVVQAAEELHMKRVTGEQEGEKEEEGDVKDNTLTKGEANVWKQNAGA